MPKNTKRVEKMNKRDYEKIFKKRSKITTNNERQKKHRLKKIKFGLCTYGGCYKDAYKKYQKCSKHIKLK